MMKHVFILVNANWEVNKMQTEVKCFVFLSMRALKGEYRQYSDTGNCPKDTQNELYST
jgi:hypothetical protein